MKQKNKGKIKTPLGMILKIKWHGQRDLNSRHQVLETCALPTELCPYKSILS